MVTSPSDGQVQPTSQREDHHETGQHETRACPRRLVDVALALLASHRVSGRGCERADDARGGGDQDRPAQHVRKAGELLAAFTAVVLHDHLESHKKHAQDRDREADPARPGDDGADVRAHTGRGGAVAAGPRQAACRRQRYRSSQCPASGRRAGASWLSQWLLRALWPVVPGGPWPAVRAQRVGSMSLVASVVVVGLRVTGNGLAGR